MTLSRKLSQADKALAWKLKGREKEIRKAYSLALKEVRSDIALAYERYGGSYAEMQKYNRLASLEKNIQEELRKLSSKNAMTLKKGIAQAYSESYYLTGYTFETGVEARLGFGTLNPKTIEAAIYNPFDPLKWNDRLREHTRLLDRRIREEVTRGLIQGKPYQEMARAIRDPFEKGAFRTMRIIQTEAHRCQVQGRLDGFDDARDIGVEFDEIWSSTLDDKTREDHQDMDGEKAEMVDGEPMFTLPDGTQTRGPGLSGIAEQDIGCRCGVRAEIRGYGPKVRRARDANTGKNKIVPNMTYNEWKNLKGI